MRTRANEIVGVAVLGMQRIGGDDRTGDVDAVQQRREGVDLIGLAVRHGLTQDNTAELVERCK